MTGHAEAPPALQRPDPLQIGAVPAAPCDRGDDPALAARLDAAYGKIHSRLRKMAYRMLGSLADAEDAAQEVYVRARQADLGGVACLEGYLLTIAMRLCLSEQRSARRRREDFLADDPPDLNARSPESATEAADELAFALMRALETLSPPERAAFLMHDVFEMPFGAVAAAIGKPQTACRQLASRARRRLRAGDLANKVSAEAHESLVKAFAAAVEENRPDRLEALLAADVVAWSNGDCGIVPAPLRPVRGRKDAADLVIGLEKKSALGALGYEFHLIPIGGALGLAVTRDGRLAEAFVIDTDGRRIRAIFALRDLQGGGQRGAP